jgi:hypothetical protein
MQKWYLMILFQEWEKGEKESKGEGESKYDIF